VSREGCGTFARYQRERAMLVPVYLVAVYEVWPPGEQRCEAPMFGRTVTQAELAGRRAQLMANMPRVYALF
jgi:hypothetical protein